MNAGTYFAIALPVAIVLAIAAIVLLVLAIRKFLAVKNGEKDAGGMALVPVFGVVGAALIAGAIAVAYVAFTMFPNSIDAIFTSSGNADASVESTKEDWLNLAYDIGNEGMVLLKNEEGALPLASGTKINLLGYAGWSPVYSGSGSGNVSAVGAISFEKALTDAGFEINTAPIDEGVYSVEVADESVGFMGAAFEISEPSVSSFKGEASFDKMAAYSDIALVVIGRSGGEAADLTKFESTNGKHYLELSDEEEELVKKASETFGTVVLVYNGANALEMGFVDEYDLDAAIWVGIPGPNGLVGFANILSGAVNPSGKLPDTYAYDVNSAAAMENFGEQKASNADEYYVDYVENVYVGYKWYETAYAEGAKITNTKTGDTYDFSDFESVVQYPFGYGLSYTTFEQSIKSVSTDKVDPMGDATVVVEVKNTGDVAGKCAVQLYVSLPYTDYDKSNGVEKSAVQLLAIGKTKLLEPGESQEVELTFKGEDLASYDMSHANADGTTGAYMLDAGDYVLSLRSDSHTEIESKTLSLASQFFYEGDNKRPSDEVAASNQMDFAARGTYLSRADAFANYADAMGSVVDTVDTSAFSDNYNQYDASYDEGDFNVTTGNRESKLELADMAGLDYDDPLWDQLISQMRTDDMVPLVQCMYNTAAVNVIKKTVTQSSDGPLGISSMFSTGNDENIAFPCIPLLAATFNTELAYRFGSYFADQAHAQGITTWYGPAMDIHRTPFSGRNFEYYSEDGVLSALIGAAEVKGARDKGIVATIKHFALNDQESQRSGMLHTYSNEQAAREIYFKPFESSIKDGGANAIMNSMNYVGDKWIGVCPEIQQEIVRGEWGFKGSILTDMAEGDYCTGAVDAALRSGTDIWLAMSPLTPATATDADIYYLQRACHNILYAEANSQVAEAAILPWRPVVGTICGALGVGALACLVAAATRVIGKKKEA